MCARVLLRAVLLLWCLSVLCACHAAPGPSTGSGPVLVVLAKAAAEAVFVDPDNGAELARVPVGIGPHEAATSPDGRLVVVCNYGAREPGSSLTVIDALARKVVRTIELRRDGEAGEDPATQRYFRPHGVQFLPDGHRVAVTTEVQRRLLVVDVESGVVERAIPTNAALSHMVALEPQSMRAFVANIGGGSISAIDVARGEPIAVIETGAGSEGIAVHPSRAEVWVANRAANTLSIVDTRELRSVAQLDCGAFPIRVAFTPDGRRALVSCATAGAVEVFDVATRVRVLSVPMTGPDTAGADATAPVPVGILLDPDGSRAFVANTQIDRVAVLDLVRGVVARHIPVAGEPDGMAWIPAAIAR